MKHHRVAERIYARGIWKAKTAIHLGGESEDSGAGIDLVVLRDSHGRPYLPAASIAGACRNHLARILLETGAYLQGQEKEPAVLHVLFGDDYQSLLTVFDAPLAEETRILMRDGVRIESNSGIAADKGKYDLEMLPAGAAFSMELALTLFEELPDYWARRSDSESSANREAVSAENLRSCYRLLLESLQRGEVRLGAKTRRGLGTGNVENWEIRRLEMANREALAAWLSHDPYSYVSAQMDDLGPALSSRDVPAFVISATFALDSSLLIRSPGEDPNGPEFSQLSEKGKALLTGTSLTGALRHRAEKIANTIGSDNAENTKLVEQIFGYVHENNPEDPGRASRLRVAEVELPGDANRFLVQGRVSVDRFTGGALETALFDEAAYWPTPEDRVSLSFHLEDPECSEVGLLLLAFKDLWLGDLPVGGEAGVGRGVLSGRHARLCYPSHAAIDLAMSDSGSETKVSGTDTSWLNHCVEQLWRNLTNA